MDEYDQEVPYHYHPKILKVPDLREDKTLKSLEYKYEALVRYTRAQKLMIKRREKGKLSNPRTIKIRKCQECGNLVEKKSDNTNIPTSLNGGLDTKVEQENLSCPSTVKIPTSLNGGLDIKVEKLSQSLYGDQILSFNQEYSNSNVKCNMRKSFISWSPSSVEKYNSRKSKISLINKNCDNNDDNNNTDYCLLKDNQLLCNTDKHEDFELHNYNGATSDESTVLLLKTSITSESSGSEYKMIADNIYASKSCLLLKQVPQISSQNVIEDLPIEGIEGCNQKKDYFTWLKKKMKKSIKKNKHTESSKNKLTDCTEIEETEEEEEETAKRNL